MRAIDKTARRICYEDVHAQLLMFYRETSDAFEAQGYSPEVWLGRPLDFHKPDPVRFYAKNGLILMSCSKLTMNGLLSACSRN